MHNTSEGIIKATERLDSLMLKVEVATEHELLPGHVFVAPAGLQTGVVRRGGKFLIQLKSDALYRPSVDYPLSHGCRQ